MDLKIGSPRVSGRHAELIFIGDTLFLRDLGSTNGTFINRERVIQPVAVQDGDHIELADVEFLVRYQQPQQNINIDRLAELKKTVQDASAIKEDWMLSQFNEFLLNRRVTPHYQIIVDLQTSQISGYESLARSDVPGLEHPGKMFHAAELVNREIALSIICRERAIEVAADLNLQKPIFMNTHPHENFDLDVLPSIVSLRHLCPEVAIVIEFHEKTIESAASMLKHKAMLDEVDVKIAYDDFGAGQSRLLELIKAPPHYLKFDRCLIQDINQASSQQLKMIKSLVDAAQDAGITTLAEGIETQEEAAVCCDMGFQLGQGYFYGYPEANPIS